MNTTLEIRDSAYAKLLAKALPRVIHSEAEHARLTADLIALDEREDLSPEEQALAELLTILIENYEEKAFPLPPVSPADSLKALMEDRGLKHKDIWPVLGNKGTATEVLHGPRSISKAPGKALGRVFPRAGRSLYLIRQLIRQLARAPHLRLI